MTETLTEFAASSNGDRWFLARDLEDGTAHVVHKANAPSGGAETRIAVEAFLNRGPQAPEHAALAALLAQPDPPARATARKFF